MKEQSTPVNDSHRDGPAPTPITKAASVVSHQPEETEATTNMAMATSWGDTSNEPFVDV